MSIRYVYRRKKKNCEFRGRDSCLNVYLVSKTCNSIFMRKFTDFQRLWRSLLFIAIIIFNSGIQRGRDVFLCFHRIRHHRDHRRRSSQPEKVHSHGHHGQLGYHTRGVRQLVGYPHSNRYVSITR